MRSISLAMCAFALVTAPLATSAQTIERFKPPVPGPAPILQSAKIPGGSEILYLSGQLASPIDPKTPPSPTVTLDQMGDTKTQTVSVLAKIRSALEARGYKMSDVIKLTVFVVADPRSGRADFQGMNEGFRQYFGTTENPETVVRSAVQVSGLATPAFLVEIEATAAKPR